MNLDIWNEHVVFTWQWWLGILLCIAPVVLWIYLRDKSNTLKLLIAGLTSAILDSLGNFMGFFDYQYDVIPLIPNYFPWDFTIVPTLVMFAIQLFKDINVYLKGVILSALISFVGLPVLRFIGIYKIMDWNYFYSFLSMFLIFVLAYQMSKISNSNET